MLKFLGRGSAFADKHNSAFFFHDNDLILIDCPASSFQKVKKMNLSAVKNIYILITHTHGDHSGGVGTMLQFAWFVLQNPVTIVAPSDTVKNDLLTLLIQIEGCEPEWFNIVTADEFHCEWLVSAVLTTHAQTLNGKCFGYHLSIQGNDVVYTGDTATLDPFLPLLHSGAYLYSEISFYKSEVHLFYMDTLPILKELVQKGVKVYLMHLDNEEKLTKMIQNTGLELAPLYQGE
ncbi:MAG TPA: hypothetical protein DCO72_04445 [Ruminococcus sp.]|nr:hypothetical protein [Ruminococcus sp.]